MDKKEICISHSFKTKSEVTDRTILVAEAFGLGIDDEKEFPIYEDFKFSVYPNDIVYITGDSGSGKSWLLKNVFKKFENSISIDEIKIDSEEVLIEGVGKDLNDALKKLNFAGLGDAFLYLRKYKQLSDGQKYRYRIAKFIDSEKDIWILDEFCATLDRTTAKIVSYNLQKIARKLNKMVICATTHEDLKDSLRPSLYIRKGLESDVKCERSSISKDKFKLNEIYKDITVEKGTIEDYKNLKRFHYRQSKLGAVKSVYTMKHKNEIIGIVVVCYPHLALKGRNIYNNKKYAKMTKENCTRINQEYECIARVVIHPKYRGLGLSYHMLNEYFKLSDCEHIETVAVMANYNPFFEKAGMTRIDTEGNKQREDQVRRLEKFGFNISLLSSKRYFLNVFNVLSQQEQEAIVDIALAIIDKYKGASTKIMSKIKSLGENWKEELKKDKRFVDFIPELQRANTVYLVRKNQNE